MNEAGLRRQCIDARRKTDRQTHRHADRQTSREYEEQPIRDIALRRKTKSLQKPLIVLAAGTELLIDNYYWTGPRTRAH